jgi:uncharacterized protein (TIGR02246 family)
VDKDKKPGKPFAGTPTAESEEATPSIGPYNPALGEIYQRLYPEIKRAKPDQEAIAAALQAMQRLTMKVDSETAVEETTKLDSSVDCPSCGHPNRGAYKFCGMCGLPMDRAAEGFKAHDVGLEAAERVGANGDLSSASSSSSSTSSSLQIAASTPKPLAEFRPAENLPPGMHHYHHHYHHFPGGGDFVSSASAPRANAPESARETDRMRIAAAAKGEPMSRGEAAVRRLTQEWVLACNMRQLDELLELYAPDALVLRANMPLLRGAAAVREFFFSALESGLGEVAVEPIRVEVNGDLAHEVGRYSALVPGTAGKRREERGKYLWVFAKQSSGEWKLISECWCSDLTLTNAESDVPKMAAGAATKPVVRRS